MALVVKNSTANAGDIRGADSMHGSERSPGGGHANPLQYSCLENLMAIVHGVTKSQTLLRQLSTHARFFPILGSPPLLQGWLYPLCPPTPELCPPTTHLGEGPLTHTHIHIQIHTETHNGFRISPQGILLVVQWLRICLPMQETWVQSLIRELRSHVPWSN